MNPRSYLEVRYDLTRYTAVLTGNEYADLTTTDGKARGGHDEARRATRSLPFRPT